MTALLEVHELQKHYPVRGGLFRRRIGSVQAVNQVSFTIHQGETLGLVGESGCGKSTVGKTLLYLEKPTGGRIYFDGQDISRLDRKALRHLRQDIQIIFQDPFDSLNARHTVGTILEEPYLIHKSGTAAERNRWIDELLARVGLPASAKHRYPHEFSGGQRQRIGIARAISLKPRLIVCDEPVSALDVSIQSQILNLLLDLQQEMNLALLFIAHNLAVVKHVSDRIAVMYLGDIVEIADAQTICEQPRHPYTQALISAIPIPDPTVKKDRIILTGDIPSPINPPSGCRFHTRCPYAQPKCQQLVPPLAATGDAEENGTHRVACHYWRDLQRHY